jgi:hypothetical protein
MLTVNSLPFPRVEDTESIALILAERHSIAETEQSVWGSPVAFALPSYVLGFRSLFLRASIAACASGEPS